MPSRSWRSAPAPCTSWASPPTRPRPGPPSSRETFWPTWGERSSGFRYLLRDRDSRYTEAFDAVFAADGIEILKTAPQAPRMNAHIERFIRTARAECTDRLLIYNEQHARRVLAESAEHYNTGRPHRALQLRAPGDDPDVVPSPAQRIQRRDVLDGLIHEYRNAS
ncbi:integrase core domain-containing protein [Streptomyces nodosus]|uniref:integrase core domain-containing protein n=1 Tax=Streptomyces nodosus TaxID=40318 RepID=UPI0036EEEE32